MLAKGSNHGDEVQEKGGRKNSNRCLKLYLQGWTEGEMLGDAEDEGFKTFETPEVSGTWTQRYTAFSAPWKTDSGVTPAM